MQESRERTMECNFWIGVIAVVVCFSCAKVSVASQICARFEFPDNTAKNPDKLVLLKGDDNTVTARFLFNTSGCPETVTKSNFTIMVAKATSTTYSTDICKLQINNGKCVSFSIRCACPDDKGRYLVKEIKADDETEWNLKIMKGLKEADFAEKKTLTVEIQWPVRITQLSLHPAENYTVTPEVFQRGTSVDILCEYEVGKPVVDPVLRKSSKALLFDGTVGLGTRRRHRIQSVRCDDSGEVTCEAHGASQNQSALLLVVCPPTIAQKKDAMLEFSITSAAVVPFDLKSYTKKIISCDATVTASRETTDSHGNTTTTTSFMNITDCSSNLKVKGTPPDLEMTLTLTKATGHEENWMLSVANAAGSKTVSFTVKFTDFVVDPDVGEVTLPTPAPEPTEGDSEQSTEDSSSAGIVIGVVITVVVIVIVISAVIVWMVIRRGRGCRNLFEDLRALC